MFLLRLDPRGRSLAIALLLLGAALAAFLVTTPVASAASPNFVAGNACASGSTPTWQTGDTWILYGNVTVPFGCTLTVEPGAIVQGDPGVRLYIDGVLVAGGVSTSPSQFLDNQTTGLPWSGIQFNATATGSVTWSSFDRVLVAITARSSSPAINNNTIAGAGAGVRLDGSNAKVAYNRIDGGKIGSYGVLVTSSSSTILGNEINGTSIGIQAGTPGSSASGSPLILDNTITNVSGALAIGIYATNLVAVTISGNALEGGLGAPGPSGTPGASTVGILANGTASITITGNRVIRFHGGRGGPGATNALLAGGAGGLGGGAAGIAVGSASTALVQANAVDNLTGGRGGDGGSSGALKGGPGGPGGDAVGIEVFSATTSASYLGNSLSNVTGGPGGDGGAPGTGASPTGPGGSGGSAYGLFSLKGMNPDLSSNAVRYLRGGRAGNSTQGLGSSSGGTGGTGGESAGVIVVADGSGLVHANTVASVLGGAGGNAITNGGDGGNATAFLVLGDGQPFNGTAMTFNRASSVTGGEGGIGGTLSGDGGAAGGVAVLHANPDLVSNSIATILGGAGGQDFAIVNQASQGGQASGLLFLLAPSASSSRDAIASVAHGAPGGGQNPAASYGMGYYFVGNSTVTTGAGVVNATLTSVGDFDFYVDNYTSATALNTSFSSSNVAIMAAGNLTLRNFLTVRVLWPNNFTTVWGARIAVKDNGVERYNQTSPFGSTSWIAVTNRVYTDSPIPTWNSTQVRVSYQAYTFANNPRSLNVTAIQTQSFTMVDGTAPSSAALPLRPWTANRTITVGFSSSDGFGVGIRNVTLWYRLDGGAWTDYGNQSFTLLGFGAFTFNAPADGTYEFATTAIDLAGNLQQPSPPTANNTWTIVDTVAPASHVLALPRYETSSGFSVSWAPDAGITDVANYTIQVNSGSGWSDWLVNTTATSATFTATAQGSLAFRVLARDFAGNAETKSGNDTWTLVDTVAPHVLASTPSGSLSTTPGFIVLTFSEPMNESAVQAAFALTPTLTGTFTWSNGSTTLIFQPAQPFAAGTTYSVSLGTGARDLAGNGLAQADLFTFATPAPPTPPGLSLGDLWPLLVVVAVALAAIGFFLLRRRSVAEPAAALETPKPAPAAASPAKSEAAIDDVFLLYRRDGVLIKHETRRLRPDIDTDILSGMLTAVQQFVKDSFRGDEGEELNEMTVGQMHILIGRGKWLILAATITGGDVESMTAQIQKAVEDMETHNWDRLEDWDGDMDLAKALGPYLKKLIRGEYAA